MVIRKGDKLLCIKEVSNVFGLSPFKKGEVYEVLCVDNEQIKTYITLNNMLYSNEYKEYEIEWVLNNFKKL